MNSTSAFIVVNSVRVAETLLKVSCIGAIAVATAAAMLFVVVSSLVTEPSERSLRLPILPTG